MRGNDTKAGAQKVIKLKKEGKTVYQFTVNNSAISTAEKQGVSAEQYILARAKIELYEWQRKQNA